MVFADGRMVERVDQLESEVAQLQDTVVELKEFVDNLQANLLALQSDPAIRAFLDSVDG